MDSTQRTTLMLDIHRLFGTSRAIPCWPLKEHQFLEPLQLLAMLTKIRSIMLNIS